MVLIMTSVSISASIDNISELLFPVF